jgi:hypothetical protein
MKIKILIAAILSIFQLQIFAQTTTADSLHQYVETIKDGRFTKEITLEKTQGTRTAQADTWQNVPECYWKGLTTYNKGKNKDGKTVTAVKVWARYDIGINELMRGIICSIEYTNEDKTKDNDILLVIYHNHFKGSVSQKSIFTIQPETPVIFTQPTGKTKYESLVKISNKLTFYCYSKFTKNNIIDNAFGNYKVDDITGETIAIEE